MKTLGELKREKGIQTTVNTDHLYRVLLVLQILLPVSLKFGIDSSLVLSNVICFVIEAVVVGYHLVSPISSNRQH